MRADVRIAGHRWYDVGSDVSWEEHGGRWARRSHGSMWFALRFDPASDPFARDRYGAHVAIFEIDTTTVPVDALRSIGADPHDLSDDYGAPLSPLARDLLILDAAIGYGYGIVETLSGPVLSDQRRPLPGEARRTGEVRLARWQRTVAARYLLGQTIDVHPFRWGPAFR